MPDEIPQTDAQVRGEPLSGRATDPGHHPLDLRAVRQDDANDLHALLCRGLPDINGDPVQWRQKWQWQCWSNPYRDERPVGWVLVVQGRIVGHLGVVYLPMMIGGSRYVGAVGVDYIVDTQAQERGGTFSGLQLARTFFRETADCIHLATTANENTNAVFGRLGCRPVAWTNEMWRAPTTIEQQIRTIKGGASRVYRRLLRGSLGPITQRALQWPVRMSGGSIPLPLPSGCRLEVTTPRLAHDTGLIWDILEALTLDESVGSWLLSAAITVERSRDYYAWRYARHPEHDAIRVLSVRDRHGPPIGLAVIHVTDRADHTVAYLEELLVLPQREDVVHPLVCAALYHSGELGADHLVMTTGRRALRPRFWEWGFEQRARSAPALLIAVPDDAIQGRTASRDIDDRVEFWHGDMF